MRKFVLIVGFIICAATVSAQTPSPTGYASSSQGVLTAALPINTPSVVYPSESGYTVTAVASGADLQAAITAAGCGTVLSLAHNGHWSTASYYSLPNTSCACHTDPTKWVIIRSDSYVGGSTRGTRLDPSTEYANLAHIVSTDGNYAFFAADNGTSCYWFGPGLDVVENSGNYEAVFQWGDVTTTTFAHDVVWDHSYIHGYATAPLVRCIALLGNWEAVVDSYLSDCHKVGQDSDAIVKWDGQGPLLVQNNFLEASTEGSLIGGASSQAGITPSDITFKQNYYLKPLAWRQMDPTYEGIHWGEKNIFEFKVVNRGLVTGNVFVNSWLDAQNGTPILFNSGCSGTSTPDNNVTQDVNFYYNILENAPAAIALGGCADTVTQQMHRLTFHDNLYYNIDPVLWGGGNSYHDLLLGCGAYGTPLPAFCEYAIEGNHETFASANLNSGVGNGGNSGTYNYDIALHNSILDTGLYGAFFGNGGSTGDAYVSGFTPNGIYTDNCYYGSGAGVGTGAAFAGKVTVANQAAIFTTPGSVFTVTGGSACHAIASDGLDPGANIAVLNTATSGVVQTLGNLHTATTVSPSTFTHTGGTGITITGTNFISGEAAVIVGGAGPPSAVNTNSCGFTAPGLYTVTAFTDTGHFTYTGGCVVVMTAPITVAVNDTINFYVNSAETTGNINRYTPGNLCTSVVVVSPTSITCNTPSASGTVTIGPVSVFVSQFGIPVQATTFPSYN